MRPTTRSVPGSAWSIAAAGDDTVLTRTLDPLEGTEWPDDVAGRTIREPFTDAWDGRESALLEHLRWLTPDGLAEARRETRRFWAGMAASFVVERESAAQVVGELAGDAARVLAAAASDLVSD